MAFTAIDKYTAHALEKGLSTAIRAGDCRFQGYGADNKKSTADDDLVGPVAYAALSDPKNEDPDIAKNDDDEILGAAAYVRLDDPDSDDPVIAAGGTVTKIYFAGDKLSADPHAAVETVHDVGDAVATAKGWVETATSSGGKSYLFTLRARIANCIRIYG